MKVVLALLGICSVVILAARDIAPSTSAGVVLVYALGGAVLLGAMLIVAMWFKFAVNQFLLNAGATDSQWLWFKSNPRGFEALRSPGSAHQTNDDVNSVVDQTRSKSPEGG